MGDIPPGGASGVPEGAPAWIAYICGPICRVNRRYQPPLSHVLTEGCRPVVCLPIRASGAIRASRVRAPSTENPFMADSESPVVYLLDDDEGVRTALGRLLRAAGHPVETFASVREFLDYDRADRPGCLVSDLRLPEVDGMELFAMLRVTGRALPIVFITGYGSMATGVRAMKEGAVDFLAKPVDDIVL